MIHPHAKEHIPSCNESSIITEKKDEHRCHMVPYQNIQREYIQELIQFISFPQIKTCSIYI
jgi:hypothetical protein